MTALALLFTLSAVGISETVYLIRKRVALERPVCPIGDNCAAVLESKYNKIFLVQNDVLGLLSYILMALCAAFLVLEIKPVSLWNTILTTTVVVTSAVSVFFTYLQWRVIKSWCFWCLMSAFTIWIMGIIILIS